MLSPLLWGRGNSSSLETDLSADHLHHAPSWLKRKYVHSQSLLDLICYVCFKKTCLQAVIVPYDDAEMKAKAIHEVTNGDCTTRRWKQEDGPSLKIIMTKRRKAWILPFDDLIECTFVKVPSGTCVCSRHFHSGKRTYFISTFLIIYFFSVLILRFIRSNFE